MDMIESYLQQSSSQVIQKTYTYIFPCSVDTSYDHYMQATLMLLTLYTVHRAHTSWDIATNIQNSHSHLIKF